MIEPKFGHTKMEGTIEVALGCEEDEFLCRHFMADTILPAGTLSKFGYEGSARIVSRDVLFGMRETHTESVTYKLMRPGDAS